MPPFKRAEVTRQGFPKYRSRLAPLPETVEVKLVEDHRIGGDEFLALQTIHDEDRRSGEVELRQLRRNGVEPFHRPAVVVLVVADDQLFRQALESRRVTGQRLHFIGHRWLSLITIDRLNRQSGYLNEPSGLPRRIISWQ
jgi:hypothetical protein